MSTYNINLALDTSILYVGFGEPANNDQIVKDAIAAVKAIKEELHSRVLRVNGAASMPVTFAISAEIGNVTKAIAVFDPKLKKYVVSVTRTPEHQIGDLID